MPQHRPLTRRPPRLLSAGLLVVLLAPAAATGQDGPPRAVVDASDPGLRRVARALPVDATLRVEALALEGQGVVDLELERFRVFARDARVRSRGRNGHARGQRGRPDNAYFRGYVEGVPGSHAVLALRGRGGIRGVVTTPAGHWLVRPARGGPGIWGRGVDAELDLGPQAFTCGTDRLLQVEADAPAVGGEGQQVAGNGQAGPSYTARVVVETDYEFYARFNDEAAATDYVGDLFAYASSVYQAELDTTLVVSSLTLWTEGEDADPWTATDCTNALYDLRDYWNDATSDRPDVDRTLVHMLSGKNSGCGIAYVGVLCNEPWAYGVSASLVGNFDIDDPAVVWDILVVTHEIGHNFSSHHTHCYAGIGGEEDIDHCYSGESGCYAGVTSLPNGCPGAGEGCGTIMSYCHLLSGGYGNISLTLGLGHEYGIDPGRVPGVMYSHVQSVASAEPECLAPVLPTCSTDADCDDGLWCNGAETCVDELCVDGAPPTCADEVDCTTDACDEDGDVCTHTPDDSACADDVFCDGVETCDPVLGCQPGSAVDCDDGIACTADACDEGAGSCANVPVDTECDNGLFCDGVEICDASLGCRAGQPPCDGACDEDQDVCAGDVVDVLTARWQRWRRRLTVRARSSAQPDVELSLSYTVDGEPRGPYAMELRGGRYRVVVVHTPFPDAGVVTVASTGGGSATGSVRGCRWNVQCDDGAFCNGEEACQRGVCRPGEPPCAEGEACGEEVDACGAPCANDAECDDGLYCNGPEVCRDGVCLDGAPVDCDDGVGCTDDACDEDADACTSTPDDGRCDNGLACDGAEWCDATGCQDGDPVLCEAPTPVCDEGPPPGCVECLSDEDCGGDTPVCDPESHTCVADVPDEVTIVRGSYRTRNGRLRVIARSSKQPDVELDVTFLVDGEPSGPFPMRWRRRRRDYVLHEWGLPLPDGDEVTVVSSGGGSATATLRVR